MVRGVWLPRATLDSVLERIEGAYHEAAGEEPDDERLDAFVAEAKALHAAGFVFMDHHVDELAGLLRARGRGGDARAMEGLRARL